MLYNTCCLLNFNDYNFWISSDLLRHRVRAVKEIDSKSIGVSLAGSSPVGVVCFCSF